MRVKILFSLIGGIVAALGVWMVLALFTDTHITTGQVSLATSEDLALYICEPIGGEDETGDPECPGDDDGVSLNQRGPDEIIFSGEEKVIPGETGTRHWDIRLRNNGNIAAWDVMSAQVVPGTPGMWVDSSQYPECAPNFRFELGHNWIDFSILGKNGDSGNDNHLSPTYSGALSGAWPLARESMSPEDKAIIHVTPGDYEDIRIRAIFRNLPEVCEGAKVNIAIALNVAAH